MDNLKTNLPKIWIATPDAAEAEFSAMPDCDCACSEINREGLWDSHTLRKEVFVEPGQDLHLAPDVFTRRYDERTVFFSARKGRVVVLDKTADSLLSLLPCTPEYLGKQLPVWSSDILSQVIALLVGTGIVTHSQQSGDEAVVTKPSHTLSAWLHLTGACNLNCVYCYVPKSSRNMTPAVARDAVDAVFRSALAHSYANVKLKYAGGEPTLNFSALLAAQQHAKQQSAQTGIGLRTVLLTNGYDISDAQIGELLAHNIAVSVSLDGLGHYQEAQRRAKGASPRTFEHVCNTLDRLKSHGIRPIISITLTSQNLPGLPELVDFLLDRGLHFSFNFYRPPTSKQSDPLMFRPDEAIAALTQAFQVIEAKLPSNSLLAALGDRANLATPHLRTCGVGDNYLVIGCEGEVYKCQMDLQHPLTSIIEEDDPLMRVRADAQGIQNLSVENKACRTCLWRYYCTGGCPRLTHQQTGHYDEKSPLCEVYQAILPEVVHLEALRMLRYGRPWGYS